jgi:pimeloyl-ACP methyl ester carboxylesterase
MAEPSRNRVMGNGVEIQLARWEGYGETVLCIHGLTANCRCWDVIASALAPSHRVLAVDLRGRGLSGAPSSGYSLEHHCRDIYAVLEELELERIVLMGHSLGALISLAFGARYPQLVDRIILVDGGGKLSEVQMAKVLQGIKPSLDRLGQVFPSFETYLAELKKAPFLQPWSRALEVYFRYEIEEVDGGIRSIVRPAHIEEELINLRKVDAAQFYPKISCSVLILRATEGMLAQDDILLPDEASEKMLREIPDARLTDVDGTNHYAILFQPNEVRDQTILGFLAK